MRRYLAAVMTLLVSSGANTVFSRLFGRASERPRTVLIDVGAHCGNSYRQLLSQRPWLNVSNLEAYLWEPNPVMLKWYLRDVERADHRVRVMPYAAWTANQTMSLFLTKKDEDLQSREQYEARQGHGCVPGEKRFGMSASSIMQNFPKTGRSVQIPTIDFLAWYRSLGLKRRDRVEFKLDAEGSEYAILGSILDAPDGRKLWCTIDRLSVEWHHPEGSFRRSWSKTLVSRVKKQSRLCNATVETWL